MRRTAKLAAESGVPVRLHALQGLLERRLILDSFGVPPLQVLARIGLLGPKLLIPHGIYVNSKPLVAADTEADIATLAASGTTVIHCPLTIARHGAALDSFERYRAAGVPLALSTDSFPPRAQPPTWSPSDSTTPSTASWTIRSAPSV